MANDERNGPSRIAWHESGHACVALQLGLIVEYVTTRPSEFSSIRRAAGYVDVEVRSTRGHAMVRWPGIDVNLEPWCLMCLAGPAAERRRFGESTYGDSDIAEVRNFVAIDLFCPRRLRQPTEEEISAAMAEYRDKADTLVSECWEWIRAVAEDLDRLTGLRCDEIVALRHQHEREPAL